MATTATFLYLLLLLNLFNATSAAIPDDNPYLSKTTLFSDFSKMLTQLKIFVYPPPSQYTSTVEDTLVVNLFETLSPPLSIFYTSLMNSPFITRHPSRATLFFLPFPPTSTRSLARHIQHIREAYPFWNRTLGADHFYLTRHSVGPASTRNVVELVKNAVQVTCFPSTAREFVPHKDVTLPPYFPTSRAQPSTVPSTRYLGYATSAEIFRDLVKDDDFLIESDTSDAEVYLGNMKQSKFCLFNYDDVEGLKKLGAALALGCVPVIITDRPIQDFPLMDIIRWSEIALFVGSSVGKDEMKRVLESVCKEGGGYEKRRRLGMAVARHMMWDVTESGKTELLDAFEMVVYQLWLRRHAIRYANWEGGSQSL